MKRSDACVRNGEFFIKNNQKGTFMRSFVAVIGATLPAACRPSGHFSWPTMSLSPRARGWKGTSSGCRTSRRPSLSY